jgi:hypothetical protein
MKADLRISIKDYRWTKDLKIFLQCVLFGLRQFYAPMRVSHGPQSGRQEFGSDSFVPDGTSGCFLPHPPINRWAIFMLPLAGRKDQRSVNGIAIFLVFAG